MKDHFEALVEKELVATAQAALDCPRGDSHKHAEIKGMALGLRKSLELYRKANRIDALADEAA